MKSEKEFTKKERDLADDYKLPDALQHYANYDFALKLKVRFTYYLCISAFAFIIPIIIYTLIIQSNDPAGLEIPVLLAEIFVAIIFLISYLLLVKGYYQIAAQTLLTFALASVWFIIIVNSNGDITKRLDTVVFVFPVLAMLPLFISKNKLMIPLYVVVNLIVLIAVLMYLNYLHAALYLTLLEYFFDVSVSLIFIGIVAYNTFLINNLSLNKAAADIQKRKAAEESLFLSEKKYREMTELLPQTVFEFDLTGKLTYINKNGLKLFGYNEDDFNRGAFLHETIAPEDRERAKNNIKNILNNVVVTSNEYTGIKKDGSRFPIEVFSSKIEKTGETIGFRGVLIDISERKATEKALRESFDKLKNVMDAASFSAIISTDLNGTIQTFNSGAELMLDYQAEEIIGSHTPMLFHKKEEVDIVSNELSKKYGVEISGFETFVYELNFKVAIEREWTFIRKDGKRLSVSLVITAINGSDGLVKGYLGVARDITESKKTQVRIRESEEKYRMLMESMKEAVILVDNDDTVLFINKRFTEMLGYSQEDIIGKKGYEVLLEQENYQLIIDNNRKRKEGESGQYEIRFKSKEGNWRDFIISASPVLDSNDKVTGSMGVMTDITEKKLFELELKQSEDRYKDLFNTMPNGYYRSTPEGYIVDANPALVKMLGYESLEELKKVNIPATLYVASSERDDIVKANPQFIKNIERYRLKTKTGKIIWVEDNARYIKDEFGKTIFYEGICKDITFEMEAEEILRKSEERYRLLAENSADIIAKHNLDGEYIYVSPSCKRILGYDQDEMIGRSPYEFIHEEDLETVTKWHNRIKELNDVDSIIFRFKKKNGDFIWSETTSTLVFDKNLNNPLEIQTASRDISKRIEIEESKLRSERNFRKIFETAPFGIVISDTSEPGTVLEINDAHLKQMNYRREDIIGKEAASFLNEDILKKVQYEFEKKGLIDDFEISAQVGEERKYFSLSSRLIEYDEKIAALNILQDITAKKIAQRELSNFGLFVQHVINSLPVIIISLNSKNEITLYNTAAQNYLAEAESNSFSSKFPTLSFASPLINKAKLKNSIVNDTLMIANEEGEPKYFNIAVSPIVDEKDTGNVILIEDVTGVKNIEQLMIQNEKMSSVAGLAAGMAHEINNPLGTIVQGCQNIIRRTSSNMSKNQAAAEKLGINMEQISDYLHEREIDQIIESVRNAAGKASEIIKNMLQFSRRSESKKVNYNIEKLIEETIDLAYNDYNLKKKYDFRNIKIDRDYEENLPELWITVTEIQQVIFNMLQNSAQAMREEGSVKKEPKIKIRVYQEEELIKIELEDNGPGMDEKTRRRVFEPFFTTKEIGEGTGLGLSVSYMIVKNNHRGNIDVNSVKGHGTKFLITLPLERDNNE